jgi:proline iminopeptidase
LTDIRPEAAHEGVLPTAGGSLFYRLIGDGDPIIVVHGGPDFDHSYLLPDLDRLAAAFQLIYYDQRGRGRSMPDTDPEDVGIESEVDDLEMLRDHLGLGATTVLGHSWGGVLAMVYAIAHPEPMSRLILVNPAFATVGDRNLFVEWRRARWPADMAEMDAIASTPEFEAGDPDAVAAYYRVHYRSGLTRAEDIDRVLDGIALSLTRDRILRGRDIEHRLIADTWGSRNWNLLPDLGRLDIPTLVITGEDDFIPLECPTHIADAIPGAQLVVLPECGHFSYLESPQQFEEAIIAFMKANG